MLPTNRLFWFGRNMEEIKKITYGEKFDCTTNRGHNMFVRVPFEDQDVAKSP